MGGPVRWNIVTTAVGTLNYCTKLFVDITPVSAKYFDLCNKMKRGVNNYLLLTQEDRN